jgi:hypothetical protein
MSKYERWESLSKAYFGRVTKQQLIEDSRKVGIVLSERKNTTFTRHARIVPTAGLGFNSVFGKATGTWVRGTETKKVTEVNNDGLHRRYKILKVSSKNPHLSSGKSVKEK